MKRLFSMVLVLALLVVCLPLGLTTYAASQEVTLSAGDSLATALANVADGGTIRVEGTVAVTAAPGTHNKTVTITGGNLDFSGLSGNVSLGDHISFENITLTFAEGRSPAQAIYANGYKVKIGENVTMPNAIRIFGGKSGGTVASTDLTVLSGTYTQIFGGGNNCNITGNVNLYVGGNVNSGIDYSSHSYTNCVYGGNYTPDGSSNTIGGTIRTVFTGNAKANYVFGGNLGPGSCTVNGGVELTVSGGNMMSVYGGSQSGELTGNVKLLVSGGNMQQVFGGCQSKPMTGNVDLDITGGTITRRVYGGCYNNYSLSGWSSSCYVNGKIVLTLHNGANITFSYDDSDRSIYAHSRQKTLSNTEESHLVYADSTAYNNYKNKVQAQDTTMKWIMGSTSAADYIHYHTYSASGNVITQNCIDSSCSASATLVVTGACYTGSAVQTGSVAYSGNWLGGDLAITYTNNVNPGTATATISCGGVTVSQEFTITRDSQLYMNGTGYASLEEAIAAAKQTPDADTITLWGNVEVASHLVFNTEITLTAEEPVTITATDAQTGSMFRVVRGGKLTIQGASADAPITLKAGAKTTNLVVNNGGEIYLTNVDLVGNENTIHTVSNKARGIFNDGGTITVKCVEIANVKGDGIYILDDGIVNLDNVTITNAGRYGIKVKGTLNITNTVDADHALTVHGSGNNAIDIEKGGKLTCTFENVPTGAAALYISDCAGNGIHLRKGATAVLADSIISAAGHCVKTAATSSLTVSNVTLQPGSKAASLILGDLNGKFTNA